MAPPQIDWKRNLAFAWLSQVMGLMGFSFGMPFAAYYLQHDLGVSDPTQAKLWMGAFSISAPITLAVMAPIWGRLADRHGRKMMMLRANFAAAVILILMGFAPNAPVLIFLRLLQGVFTGTVTAAQTLVASYTPERRQGFALGAMSASIFAGSSLGNWLGAEVAFRLGYRAAFVCSGVLLLLAGLVALWGIREHFVPQPEAPPDPPAETQPRRWNLPDWGLGGPILLMMLAISFVRQLDGTMLPFLVQELHHEVRGAELYAGRVNVMFSIGAFLGGFVWGWVADRVPPPRMARWCAILAGLAMIPQALATSFGPLAWGRFLLAFFGGGLDPVFQIWLARVTPPKDRGRLFGWSVTAKSVGWIVGPVVGTAIGVWMSVRASFYATCALYAVLLVPMIGWVAARVKHPATDGPGPRRDEPQNL